MHALRFLACRGAAPAGVLASIAKSRCRSLGAGGVQWNVRKYFFHTSDGEALEDKEGTLLPDDDAAKVLAQMVKERPADIWRDDQLKVTLTDDRGMTLGILDLSAITPASLRRPRTKPA